jgi:hypothetical protein
MLQLLVSLGEVQNYTLYGRAQRNCPPIILVWYRRVRAGTVEAMSRAFASFRGEIQWSFRATPGGWAVMPRRIPELAAERRLVGLLSGAKVLMEEEPDFAERARSDLECLAAHVCGWLEALDGSETPHAHRAVGIAGGDPLLRRDTVQPADRRPRSIQDGPRPAGFHVDQAHLTTRHPVGDPLIVEEGGIAHQRQGQVKET